MRPSLLVLTRLRLLRCLVVREVLSSEPLPGLFCRDKLRSRQVVYGRLVLGLMPSAGLV